MEVSGRQSSAQHEGRRGPDLGGWQGPGGLVGREPPRRSLSGPAGMLHGAAQPRREESPTSARLSLPSVKIGHCLRGDGSVACGGGALRTQGGSRQTCQTLGHHHNGACQGSPSPLRNCPHRSPQGNVAEPRPRPAAGHSPGPPAPRPGCPRPAPAGGRRLAAAPGTPWSAGRTSARPPRGWSSGKPGGRDWRRLRRQGLDGHLPLTTSSRPGRRCR